MNDDTVYGELLTERREPYKNFFSTLRFFAVLLAVVLTITVLFSSVFIGVQVSGSSMYPTLYGGVRQSDGTYKGGDYLFINTLASPEHGDIVVIDTSDISFPNFDADRIIKRVIGLPGDSIYAENGKLYRQDAGTDKYQLVEEPYLDGISWSEDIHPLTVDEGEIYVLGDNRPVSMDSRLMGTFFISDVEGVVTGWSMAFRGFFSDIFGLFSQAV